MNLINYSPSSFLRKPLLSPCLLFVTSITFITILSGENLLFILKQQLHDHTQEQTQQPKQHQPHRSEKEKDVSLQPSYGGENVAGGCNIFEGRWVLEKASKSRRPLYEEEECPYIQPQLTCQAYGRPDKEYQQWRWQPLSCSLPSFNATSMWEMLRGKRMMFVGDSLNRNQFASLICLLNSVIPENAKSMQTINSIIVFRAKEYNASIEFYWAPFLVESNADNAVVHRIQDRIVRRSIAKHAQHWKGVDILIFNTYLWWRTGAKMKILKGSFKDKEQDIAEVETEEAYQMALKKMVKWVDKNVDPQKSRVFFVTMSPSHSMSIEWGGEPGGNCYNQTAPIEDPTYWGSSSSKSMMREIAKALTQTNKVPITLLNITQLSEYRRDGHSTIYKKQWSPLTPQQLANPASYADCIHWCLPGLPDTWNELLYTKLLFP